MPSPFVEHHLAALVRQFGSPERHASLNVDLIAQEWGGRNPQDVWIGHPLVLAKRAYDRDRWHIDLPGDPPEPFDLVIGLSDAKTADRQQSVITVVQDATDAQNPMVVCGWRTPHPVPADVTPTEALLTLIERFGHRIKFGPVADVFITLASSDTNEIDLRDGTDGRKIHLQGVRREHPGGWQFAWGYAIDTDDYLASLA